MDKSADPQAASIDTLIDWLGKQRSRHPTAALSELLADRSYPEARLVDIACIDLMQRRRMDQAATVEDYVKEFPVLSCESDLLDLIDAEICIATELGQQVDLQPYLDRFPHLAPQIRQLHQLERKDEANMTAALIGFESSQSNIGADTSIRLPGESPAESQQSGDFSIEVLSREATAARQISALDHHPLDLPDWFIGDQCIASSPGRWLIRGRDSLRGDPVALKVTELPSMISSQQSTQILDACELAAAVHHPSWVAPAVAAIQQRHLGVIRPWLFARPWQSSVAAMDVRSQLRKLAAVAFTIEAAHGRGATHGGIHLENLMVDHEGKVQVLDGASSRAGLRRWLEPVGDHNGGSFASFDARKLIDIQGVIKLVAAASVEWGQSWSDDLMKDLRRIADDGENGVCGRIGQTMMQYADKPVEEHGSAGPIHAPASWRRRLAGWLTRHR